MKNDGYETEQKLLKVITDLNKAICDRETIVAEIGEEDFEIIVSIASTIIKQMTASLVSASSLN